MFARCFGSLPQPVVERCFNQEASTVRQVDGEVNEMLVKINGQVTNHNIHYIDFSARL